MNQELVLNLTNRWVTTHFNEHNSESQAVCDSLVVWKSANCWWTHFCEYTYKADINPLRPLKPTRPKIYWSQHSIKDQQFALLRGICLTSVALSYFTLRKIFRFAVLGSSFDKSGGPNEIILKPSVQQILPGPWFPNSLTLDFPDMFH